MSTNSKSKGLFAFIILLSAVLILLQININFASLHFIWRRKNDRFSSWTWDCIERQCIRNKALDDEQRTALNTCRMTCGTTKIVWPKPRGITTIGNETRSFNLENIDFNYVDATGIVYVLLRKASNVFVKNIQSMSEGDRSHNHHGRSSDKPIEIRITILIGRDDSLLTLSTNESYILSVRQESNLLLITNVTITAQTFFGARHGLETLSQLIWWEFVDDDRNTGIFRLLSNVHIIDEPRFNHRGIMIDTARNFIPVLSLRRTIDGMAASKLNVLHLHLTDSQSFTFQSRRYPQMTDYGLYSSNKLYSELDLRDLSDYALVRGVRILPEIDVPGHAGNGWQWGEEAGLGNMVVCFKQKPWKDYCGSPPCGQLNPNNENIYNILRGLYEELIKSIKATDLIHFGGDEVNHNCWMESEEVFPNQVNLTIDDFNNKLKEFFIRNYKALQLANGERKVQNVIVWSNSNWETEEDINKIFPKSKYIIQQWGGSTWMSTKNYIEYNYRSIISHVDAWYLDCGFGPWMTGMSPYCGPVRTWQTIYKHRPWAKMHADKTALILGGEVCLWSEKADEHSLDTKLWPRSAALAERLWSDPARRKMKDATMRLAMHRERLLERGVRADVMWPEWCNANPSECFA